ncbi:MAG: hypothetical protein KBE22_03995 [Candidatus Accumulibacter sp.]|nr:hypothetical protein [Accumulibacter sp.]
MRFLTKYVAGPARHADAAKCACVGCPSALLRRSGTWHAIASLVVFFFCFAAPNAAAQLISIVQVDVPKTLVSGDKEFESIDATIGKAESKQNVKDPKRFELVYTAPADAKGKTGVVRYSLKGSKDVQQVTVEIVEVPGPWGESYGPAFQVLFTLFVVAVVLERGLAVIFNSRIYLQLFASGMKTVFSIVFAYVFVLLFHLDVTSRLVNILWDASIPPGILSQFLSALVLAGGSSGVNSMLVALGFLSVRTIETVQPKPPITQAWISVRLKRDKVKEGPVDVLMKAGGAADFSTVGRLTGKSMLPFFRPIFRDRARFPASGGFPVELGKKHEVKLLQKLDGKEPEESSAWTFTPAAGAIIDVELTL